MTDEHGVTHYDQMPIPPVEAHTQYFEAGAVTLGVEYRLLDDAIAALKNALELAPERRDWTLELATLSSRHPAHVDDAIAIFESLRRESGDEEFRRTLADRVAELRRAAADSSDAAAPPPPMDRRKNHPTPPAPDGGSTSR